MYYGIHHYVNSKGKLVYPHQPYTCYAERRDEIRWTKPKLGLVEFNGSKRNNIVLAAESIKEVSIDQSHIAFSKTRIRSVLPRRSTRQSFVLEMRTLFTPSSRRTDFTSLLSAIS